ncbi:hypothetical protein SUGI_0609720 [Cryptomeria japonica]|nr:hypothetical protein SUGI_0609720 [Cryptomeria japonica]
MASTRAGARATRAICRGKQMGGIKISHKYESLKASSVSASASLTLDSFFGESEDEGGEELKEKAKCPPGLRTYEMMLVLRPDISEEDRLALTQRYEEMIVAGGGIGVEVFNRGLIPLAYSIKKRVALTGELDTFLDGVYLLFTYFAKPETVLALETTIKKEDVVIRSSIFKIRERKY